MTRNNPIVNIWKQYQRANLKVHAEEAESDNGLASDYTYDIAHWLHVIFHHYEYSTPMYTDAAHAKNVDYVPADFLARVLAKAKA